MVGPVRRLGDGERAPQQRLGLAGQAQLAIQRRQLMEARGGVGRLGGKRLVVDCSCAPGELLGFGGAALGSVEPGELV